MRDTQRSYNIESMSESFSPVAQAIQLYLEADAVMNWNQGGNLGQPLINRHVFMMMFDHNAWFFHTASRSSAPPVLDAEDKLYLFQWMAERLSRLKEANKTDADAVRVLTEAEAEAVCSGASTN